MARAHLAGNMDVQFDIVREDEYGDYVVVFNKVTPEYTFPRFLVVQEVPVYLKGDLVKNYLDVVVLVGKDVYGLTGLGAFVTGGVEDRVLYQLGEEYSFTVAGSELVYRGE